MKVSAFLVLFVIYKLHSCFSSKTLLRIDISHHHHYENLPMQDIEIFSVSKIENFIRIFLIFFLFFAQNIDCEAVLTSTHNLCFGAKIRKIGIPLHTPVLLYKSGVQGGIHCTDMFF